MVVLLVLMQTSSRNLNVLQGLIIMKVDNVFKNGKRIDPLALRRGAKSTDCHIFIQNDMLKFLTEIQVNYEAMYDKRIMRSRLINIAIMKLVDDLSSRDQTEALRYVKQLESEYKQHYN